MSSAQLTGELDDCFCDVESIDVFNNFKIYPRIRRLTQKDYFRYYRVRRPRPQSLQRSQSDRPLLLTRSSSRDPVPSGPTTDTAPSKTAMWSPAQRSEVAGHHPRVAFTQVWVASLSWRVCVCVFSESSPGGHQVWQLQQGEIGSAPLRGALPAHQGADVLLHIFGNNPQPAAHQQR